MSTIRIAARVLDALKRRDADVMQAEEALARELSSLGESLRDALLDLIERRGAGDWRAGILATQLDHIDRAIADVLGDGREVYAEGLEDIARASGAYMRSIGLDTSGIDTEALTIAVEAATRDAGDVFVGQSRTTAQDLAVMMREGYRLDSLDEFAARLGERAGIAARHVVTEARTQMAVYSRAVEAAYADEAPRAYGYAYAGPRDGITRPFCSAVVSRWWSRELASRLDNGVAGLPHPIESGGGYNCRHRWLIVPEAVARGWGYEVADEGDLRRANGA